MGNGMVLVELKRLDDWQNVKANFENVFAELKCRPGTLIVEVHASSQDGYYEHTLKEATWLEKNGYLTILEENW